MDAQVREFVDGSTLLFIASRNAAGRLDVSPRGGQPSVMRIRHDGALLLPDYVGNNRLDTIGNVLSAPEVAMALVYKGRTEWLKVRAAASISNSAEDLSAFPLDQDPPVSVMVLTVRSAEFVTSSVFEQSRFWIDPSERQPSLDLPTIMVRETQENIANDHDVVPPDGLSEELLSRAGLRAQYGQVPPMVQKKVFRVAGYSSREYLRSARFLVLAFTGLGDEIDLTLRGDLRLLEQDCETVFAFRGAGDLAELPLEFGTNVAVLAVEPGRNENIRLNGTIEHAQGARLSVAAEEVFYHCSRAFSRARVWNTRPAASWAGNRAFRCVARTLECDNVVSFVLEPKDQAPIGPVRAGQYVTVAVNDEGRGRVIQRCYSVSNIVNDRELRITVRRTATGGMSDWMHANLWPGAEVRLRGPSGQFFIEGTPRTPVALISAGVGVTPLLPMLKHLAERNLPVWFFHGAQNSAEHILKSEVEELAAAHPGVRTFFAYSRPLQADRLGQEFDCAGRLDASHIAQVLDVANTDFYICGPSSFMSEMQNGLSQLGARSSAVKMEAFEALSSRQRKQSPTLADQPLYTIGLALSNKTLTWNAQHDNILDLALEAGVKLEYSCRNGDCGLCFQKVKEGRFVYPQELDVVMDRKNAMICQAVPISNMILDC